MAKNLRDRGYSSSTSGENNSQKSATIKDKLKSAYTGVKNSINTYSDPTGATMKDVYGNPVQNAGAYVNGVGGVSYYNSPAYGSQYNAYARTAEDMNRPDVNKEVNTPLGTINYGQDYDTRYVGYNSPLRMENSANVSRVSYDNPMTSGGHYDDYNDASLTANRNGLYAGAEMPVNMQWLGERSLNTPMGTFGIEGGYESPYGLDVSYQPQPNSILAQLLARRYGN